MSDAYTDRDSLFKVGFVDDDKPKEDKNSFKVGDDIPKEKDTYGINEVETDEIVTAAVDDGSKIVSIPAFTTTNLLEELYSRLIEKEVIVYDVYDMYNDSNPKGILKEIVVLQDSVVYIRLETVDDECNKLDTIVCIGSGISVSEAW